MVKPNWSVWCSLTKWFIISTTVSSCNSLLFQKFNYSRTKWCEVVLERDKSRAIIIISYDLTCVTYRPDLPSLDAFCTPNFIPQLFAACKYFMLTSRCTPAKQYFLCMFVLSIFEHFLLGFSVREQTLLSWEILHLTEIL